MIVRILIAVFASVVASIGYLTGYVRMMTALLIGFGALSATIFGILFILPAEETGFLSPMYDQYPGWPFIIVAAILAAMVAVLFLTEVKGAPEEPVSALHFKYLLVGVGGFLISLFVSSVYWFPSDEVRLAVERSVLRFEVMLGTIFFVIGLTLSCLCFYKASRGTSKKHPDLMRRFVLALFAFFQFDKVPLLVAYLLVYSPETKVIFPHLAALSLAAYIPVGVFLMKASWDSNDMQEIDT